MHTMTTTTPRPITRIRPLRPIDLTPERQDERWYRAANHICAEHCEVLHRQRYCGLGQEQCPHWPVVKARGERHALGLEAPKPPTPTAPVDWQVLRADLYPGTRAPRSMLIPRYRSWLSRRYDPWWLAAFAVLVTVGVVLGGR